MGIAVDNIHFGTFNMLKDLEIARNNLHIKQTKPAVVEQIEEIVEENDLQERLIEWLQDEPSETESDILVHCKKNGKLSKSKLMISPKINRKKQAQEAPGLTTEDDGGKIGLHSPKRRKKKVQK